MYILHTLSQIRIREYSLLNQFLTSEIGPTIHFFIQASCNYMSSSLHSIYTHSSYSSTWRYVCLANICQILSQPIVVRIQSGQSWTRAWHAWIFFNVPYNFLKANMILQKLFVFIFLYIIIILTFRLNMSGLSRKPNLPNFAFTTEKTFEVRNVF